MRLAEHALHYPPATRPATFIFPVPEHYKPALKGMEAMDQRRHLAAEMEAAIQTLQSDVAEHEIADSSHPTTPKKDKGKGRAKSYVSPSMSTYLLKGVIMTSHITHNLWYIRPKSSSLSPPPLDPRLSHTMPTPGKPPGNPDPPTDSRPSCTLPTPTSDSGKGGMVDAESEVINPAHAHSDSENNGDSGLNASAASIFAAGTRSPPSTPSGADANNGSGSPSYSQPQSLDPPPKSHPQSQLHPDKEPIEENNTRASTKRLRNWTCGWSRTIAPRCLIQNQRRIDVSVSGYRASFEPANPERRFGRMPKKITDESVLRQTPSQIPELKFAQGGLKKPICIIKSDIKRWYRLDKDQVAHLKPYEIVNSRTEFDERGQPRLVYLYEERKVEFEAWKAHGGYERFLRYLLRLKRGYVKRKDWEHRSFPVSPYYREPLEQLEKEEKEKMRAREGGSRRSSGRRRRSRGGTRQQQRPVGEKNSGG
ncbi:hypothetical protein NLJ89_g10020 [Agrocybe chaxingu]|uniref:Uncharacterized protein n=1 Tax=Agrocybe chaxingu TaxID=84603 RepID=A0A9W8JRD2_9AGAR|nr:hypothetical protein NLJ89_g10020 [Agrocybe chaxingu]